MSNLKWKRHLGNIWPANRNGGKIILLYHSLGNSKWAMPVKHFKDQINWLSDHCHILPLQTLIQNKPSKDLQVAITFDDGYQSLHDEAALILSDKNAVATVYLNTGWVSECHVDRKKSVASLGHYPDETFLNWPEVETLYNAGWLIGSHGLNHHNFTLVDSQLALQELKQSKQDIESRLNNNCTHFAYPFGRYSKTLKNIAQQAGYQYVVAARHGRVNRYSDLLALPRVNIEKNYSLNDFINILHGKWDYLSIIHKMKGL